MKTMRVINMEICGMSSSTWLLIKCGMPQGSILDALLFLIFINDLPYLCNSSEIDLFVDETNVTPFACFWNEIEKQLSKIRQGLISNKLALNLDKTVQMSYLKKRLRYYLSNNNPVLQYGVLVNRCGSCSSLTPLFLLQRKIFKLIYFRKRIDSSEGIFAHNKILCVWNAYLWIVKICLQIYQQLPFRLVFK